MSGRLVVVSHRSPVRGDSAAGLPAMADLAVAEGDAGSPVLWFGWSGRISQDPTSVVSIRRDGALTCVGVDLSASQYEGHLTGFSHSTLWPAFHDMPDRIRFHADDLALYRGVNGMLAARLAPLLRGGDRLWIHDYPLLPMGWMLRQCGVEAPLGFYLHVPFPSAETLLALPWRRKLADDLSAYDFIGLQTCRDLANFREFMRRARSSIATRRGDSRQQRQPVAEVLPVGIATRATMAMADSAETCEQAVRFSRCLRDRMVIVGSERLDYTKGLLERLHGYECLLNRHPSLHSQVTLVQVTTPSRSVVPGYLELRDAQKTFGQQINERFGRRGWMPLYDIYGSLSANSLAALYRGSRIGLFTPLRDGASLMARKYVASQNPMDPGVLVLSRHAGAAEQLTEALLVDPSDSEQIADALHQALTMPLSERQDRWRRMMVKLLHHDVLRWHYSFVDALSQAHRLTGSRDEASNITIATPDSAEPLRAQSAAAVLQPSYSEPAR
jgi:trehalose 6-phosphate synthase